MAVNYVEWDADEAKQELAKRLDAAKQARRHLETQWTENERAVFATSANQTSFTDNHVPGQLSEQADENGRHPTMTVSYCMKNVRFLHSQMSANPPVTQASPASSDQEDKRAADAADRLLRYAPRKYNIPDTQDFVNLNALVYGTAIGKTVFDPNKGLPTAFDEQQNAVTFEGDFDFSTVHPRKFYINPDSTSPRVLGWVFEEVAVPVDKACAMFPEHAVMLKGFVDGLQNRSSSSTEQFINLKRYNHIPLFQYWEDGTPETGCKGRFAWCMEDGTVLSPGGKVGPSPYAFRVFDDNDVEIGTYAKMPYHVFTDLDVPGTAWGQTVVSYAVQIQDMINRIDNVAADILQAHGVVRMAVPDSAEVAEEAITNNNWDVVVYAGQVAPHFMEPLPFPQALVSQRAEMRKALDDIFGITETNLGQQSRETANAAMQFAVEQSNLVRKRLFNKMTKFVESVYSDYLALIANNWTTPRTIKVLGREKAFEVLDIKGSDIRSGYDVVCEYGTSLPLDPMARQAQLMQMLPLMKEAGLTPRTILGKFRLAELESAYDATQLAQDRQREYFEQIIAERKYVEPGEEEDNVNMLEYALQWRMTAEFKNLPPDIQAICLQHIKARKELAADTVAPPPAAAGPAPAGPDPMAALMGGAPPA